MLVGEVEDLRKMMESLKRMVTGQGLEEKRGETGDQEASLEEAEEKEKEKSVGEKTRENRIEHVTARVEKIMGRGKGGTILVHIGTNNADKEGTTAIVDKYSKLLKKTKEARVGQIILSGILPVFGNRIDGYRNSKRMAINGMVKRLCKEEDVGYVDLWDSFVGKEGMYLRDGLHLSGKGAAVFAEGLSGAVASGLGKVRYLN